MHKLAWPTQAAPRSSRQSELVAVLPIVTRYVDSAPSRAFFRAPPSRTPRPVSYTAPGRIPGIPQSPRRGSLARPVPHHRAPRICEPFPEVRTPRSWLRRNRRQRAQQLAETGAGRALNVQLEGDAPGNQTRLNTIKDAPSDETPRRVWPCPGVAQRTSSSALSFFSIRSISPLQPSSLITRRNWRL